MFNYRLHLHLLLTIHTCNAACRRSHSFVLRISFSSCITTADNTRRSNLISQTRTAILASFHIPPALYDPADLSRAFVRQRGYAALPCTRRRCLSRRVSLLGPLWDGVFHRLDHSCGTERLAAASAPGGARSVSLDRVAYHWRLSVHEAAAEGFCAPGCAVLRIPDCACCEWSHLYWDGCRASACV